MKDINGVIPPCITLFDDKGNLDETANREHINFLIKNGANGIFLLGSAGEFAYLSDKEKLQILKWGIDEVNGKVPVLAGISSPSTKISIYWAKEAENIGADAVISIYHPFFPLNLNDIFLYYKTVLDEIKLPFILYNFPMITNYNINLEIIKELSERDNFIGIKDTTVDFSHVQEIKNEIDKEDFKIFIGTDIIYQKAINIGIYDIILGTSNLIPKIHVDLYQAAVKKNENEIKRLFEYFNRIIRSIVTQYPFQYHPSVIKEALSLLGRKINTSVRIPHSKIKQRKIDKLEKNLAFLKEIHQY